MLWKVLVLKKAHGYKCEHDKGKKEGEESSKSVSGTAGRNGKISGVERAESGHEHAVRREAESE